MLNKRIGIWGFGAVGNSALRFFHPQGNVIEIFDLKPATATLPDGVTYTQQTTSADVPAFLTRNDAIIVSPGIDTSNYTQFSHKFVTELDLVAQHTTTPLVGITGTIGKTTITTLLSNYLHLAGLAVGTGGNIGKPMLDFVPEHTQYDYFVFELSSFQLEYTQMCAPKLALWTNLYPNHLDRHLTVEQYFLSKLNIMRHQRVGDKALIPLSLAPLVQEHTNNFAKIHSQLYFFSVEQPTESQKAALPANAHFFYCADNTLVVDHGTTSTLLITLDAVALTTFAENVLILAGALFCLGLPMNLLAHKQDNNGLEHRLEHVTTRNNVTFYNDSKSTIMQATQAAVDALQNHAIILLLGGLSKGVDRTADVQNLAGKVREVVCFGKEAPQLFAACQAAGIAAHYAATLEEAAIEAAAQARHYDNACVLLSPGGSSFDLFANYIERGKTFKKLVWQV